MNLFNVAWAIAIVGFVVGIALVVFGRHRFDLALRILLPALATWVLLGMIGITTNFLGAADGIYAEGETDSSTWQGVVGFSLLFGLPFLVVVLIAVALSEIFRTRSR